MGENKKPQLGIAVCFLLQRPADGFSLISMNKRERERNPREREVWYFDFPFFFSIFFISHSGGKKKPISFARAGKHMARDAHAMPHHSRHTYILRQSQGDACRVNVVYRQNKSCARQTKKIPSPSCPSLLRTIFNA